jgi:hypothetical protein
MPDGSFDTTVLTLIVAVPVALPLVAVMFAVPLAMPVMTPDVALTVATDVLLDDQVNVWPVSVLPAASLATAVPVDVAPGVIEPRDSVTVTVEMDPLPIVRVACPVTPSDVALMVTVPADTAVTKPVVELTVAREVLLELQVTVRPVRTWFAASRVTAVAVVVPPGVRVEEPSVTAT